MSAEPSHRRRRVTGSVLASGSGHLGRGAHHDPVAEVARVSTDDLDHALRTAPVKLSTMGRDLDADHSYFLAAAAAGRHAANLTRKRWLATQR